MQIDNDKINHLTDLLDYASLLYYDEKEATYLDCLSKILVAYMEEEDLSLEEETIEKLHTVFEEIDKTNLNLEELRKVFLLLAIKGFKHANFSLDLITPDAIGVITAFLIESLLKKLPTPVDVKKKFMRTIKGKYKILDINYGIGNLVHNINNTLNLPISIIGIESSNILANYSNTINNFMNMDAIIYNQDALSLNVPGIDIVVSDLASYDYDDPLYDSPLRKKGVTYFPYLAIEKHLASGHELTKYVYLIDYDFFEHSGASDFKEVLNKEVLIKSLVVLPESFFQGNPKAILILDKEKTGSTNVLTLPPLTDQEKFKEVLTNLQKHLEE